MLENIFVSSNNESSLYACIVFFPPCFHNFDAVGYISVCINFFVTVYYFCRINS